MMYIVELLELLGLKNEITHCLAHTIYMNSAAKKFMKANDICHVQIPTGVKHAPKIVQKYDIGANSEQNGQGTIHVNWAKIDEALAPKQYKIEAQKLRALLKIGNSVSQDAVVNILLLEAVMLDRDYSVKMLAGLYKEVPSRLSKAVVEMKDKFTTTWDESKLTEPRRLQDFMTVFTNDTEGGRAFLRPSGTEDCLRLYVEARYDEDAQKLNDMILEEIQNRYVEHGVHERP